VKEHLPHRVGGVVDGAVDVQPHAVGVESVGEGTSVDDRSGEPVELGHDDFVARSDRSEHFLQLRSLGVPAGLRTVKVHALGIHTESTQGLALRLDVLLIHRAPCVPEPHCSPLIVSMGEPLSETVTGRVLCDAHEV
jgi:hypothetical protein